MRLAKRAKASGRKSRIAGARTRAAWRSTGYSNAVSPAPVEGPASCGNGSARTAHNAEPARLSREGVRMCYCAQIVNYASLRRQRRSAWTA